MADRVKSLKRVLAVQQQIVRLAEWRLATAQQKEGAVREDQQRLHAFVSSAGALGPVLSAAAFAKGQALQEALARNEAEVAARTAQSDAMKRRETLAERLVEDAAKHAGRVAERRQLEEALEAVAQRRDASFP